MPSGISKKAGGFGQKMIKICEYCGQNYDAGSSGHGRKRKYCSNKCTKAAAKQRYYQGRSKKQISKRNSEPEQKRKYENIDLSIANTCLNCGRFFNIVRPSCPNKFCSRKCAGEYRKKNCKIYICKYCGKEYGGKEALHRDVRYCSSVCYTADNVDKSIKDTCPICGKEFEVISGTKYCSDECRKEAAAIRSWHHAYKKQIYKRYCTECGRIFITNKSEKIFCGSACARRQAMRGRNAIRRGSSNKLDMVIEKVSYSEIYERDEGRCHICGEKVHEEYNRHDRLSGTLDHVIPLARGGDHTYDNIKLAHMVCNSIKADKVDVGVLS